MKWEMTGPDDKGEFVIVDHESYYAPEVIATVPTFENDEHDANEVGKIIEAAPDLLASLKELLHYAKRDIERLNAIMVGSLYPALNEAKIARAEAAIAKATAK